MLNQISPIIIKNGILYKSEEVVMFTKPPVYEVIRVMDGMPLFFEGHMDRLFHSLKLIDLNCELSSLELLNAIKTLVDETKILDNNVRLEIGEDTKKGITWILFWVKSHYPDKEVYENGISTVTYKVTRDNPHAKIYRSDFVENINKIKLEAEAFEVVLVKEDDTVTEGSRSNLFFIKENKVVSASEKDVLMGITRIKLVALLKELTIELIEKDIKISELDTFEACFITGTSIHILPVGKIDSVNYPSATHPLILKISKAFETIVRDDLEHTRRLK